MAEKRAYVYKFNAFGSPGDGSATAQRLDINDVFTEIVRLDKKSTAKNGRILDLRPEGGEPVFIRVLKNDKKTGVVHGIICSVKSSNHPDKFDWSTGSITPLNIPEDLLEKSHFLIDTTNGMLVFQKAKSSPNTGLLARYVIEKAATTVKALSIDVHIRKDVTAKLDSANRRGKIKLLQIKIKKSALNRVDLLGNEASTALKALAQIPDAGAIGITVSLEKYHRSGGFSVGEFVSNVKKFLGMQTSDDPISDVETAVIKTDDETVNLLTNKFAIYYDIPRSVMSGRNLDSAALISIMESEYRNRKSDL